MTKQNIVHYDRKVGFDTGTYSWGIVIKNIIPVNCETYVNFKIPV